MLNDSGQVSGNSNRRGSSIRKLDQFNAMSSSEKDDEDLIWERFKAGSGTALTHIYRNYSNLLFNYGTQFTNNRALLKDCIQDLFEELIERREKLSSTNSIKFYLMRSFRNKLVKTIQKDNKRRDSEEISSQENFKLAVSAEVKLINGQLDETKKKLLEKYLNELPILQREALILYFYEGLKYEQIAEMLGIKTKSSRTLVYRATKSLSDLISPHKDEMLVVGGTLLIMKSLL
ncbi:MAG: sigma-70 family RNA polymerase sigma factor [Cyclobacteriaceae bacterium]|nr:sigma-70 family RNA polymerase sigma factor [Cyclobacteriaceae bacterium HetDA_MAG_MS6]